MARSILTKSELDKLLQDVEAEVSSLLKSEALAKADPGQQSPGESNPSGSSTDHKPPVDKDSEESSEDSKEDDSVPPNTGTDAMSASPSASATPGTPVPGTPGIGSPDASATPGAQVGDPAAAMPQATPESLKAEYDQLAPDEKKMHLVALKASLMADMAAQPAPTVPADTSSPMGAEATHSPDMGKKEFSTPEGNGGLNKSEKEEFEALKKSAAAQKATIDTLELKFTKLNDGIKKLAERPIVKGIQYINQVKFDQKPGENAKPEVVDLAKAMTRDQVKERLSVKIREGKLSKSDSDAIRNYNYGEVGVEKVAHLIIDAK